MNRAEKAAVIDEIAASITDANAIFAVDYRGITVEQARDLRARLRSADATLRVVKNSLTERAADKAGVGQLKALLEGPTALTFVHGDGATAARSLADFARQTQLLAFKGGLMDGAALSSAEVTAISRLPSRDVLYGQLVGLVANPISGLARTLQALLSGLAVGLGGVLQQKKQDSPDAAAQVDEPTANEQSATTTEPSDEAAPEPQAAETATEAQAPADEPQGAGQPEEESPAEGGEQPTEDAESDASTSDTE